WASIMIQGYIKPKTLIDIQGLLFSCADYYYGGLTLKEILQCVYLKEILMPWRMLFGKKRVFHKRGELEKRHLNKLTYISYQSRWVKEQLRQHLRLAANLYPTKIMLREPFYTADQWTYKSPTN